MIKKWSEINEKNIITVILANLKAEMNKLEIIDGMLMESMIESLEWTAEDELEPLAIQQTSFLFFSALPNELKEEMELLTALAAQPYWEWNGVEWTMKVGGGASQSTLFINQ